MYSIHSHNIAQGIKTENNVLSRFCNAIESQTPVKLEVGVAAVVLKWGLEVWCGHKNCMHSSLTAFTCRAEYLLATIYWLLQSVNNYTTGNNVFWNYAMLFKGQWTLNAERTLIKCAHKDGTYTSLCIDNSIETVCPIVINGIVLPIAICFCCCWCFRYGY